MKDTVCINIKNYFNLWYSPWCRRYSIEVEDTEALILVSHRAFTLKNVDLNSRLVVRCRRESFRFLRWNSGVRRNHRGKYTTICFNTQSKRRNVEQENIFYFTGKNRSLD